MEEHKRVARMHFYKEARNFFGRTNICGLGTDITNYGCSVYNVCSKFLRNFFLSADL